MMRNMYPSSFKILYFVQSPLLYFHANTFVNKVNYIHDLKLSRRYRVRVRSSVLLHTDVWSVATTVLFCSQPPVSTLRSVRCHDTDIWLQNAVVWECKILRNISSAFISLGVKLWPYFVLCLHLLRLCEFCREDTFLVSYSKIGIWDFTLWLRVLGGGGRKGSRGNNPRC